MTRDPQHIEDQIKSAQKPGIGLPPLDQWHPELSGDINIRILRDGTWLYNDAPLKREAIARLFSTILRREGDGKYYLVTPVEKWCIQVDDTPLLAHSLEVAGDGDEQVLTVTTNMGEVIEISDAHPLTVDTYPDGDEPRPLIGIRHGLDARLVTSAFYELANFVEERVVGGRNCLGVASRGVYYQIG